MKTSSCGWLLGLAGLALVGCGGSQGGTPYYVRFESIGEVPSPHAMRVVGLGDELFVVGTARLMRPDGEMLRTDVIDAVGFDGALVVSTGTSIERLQDDGSYEVLSDHAAHRLTVLDDLLVSVWESRDGYMDVAVSADGGRTWEVLAEGLGALSVENGEVTVSVAADGVVYARVFGDGDLGPNWFYVGATYAVDGEGVELMEGPTGGPLPLGTTPDGKVIVDISGLPGGNYVGQPLDELGVVRWNRFDPSVFEVEEGRDNIHYAMPGFVYWEPSWHTFGLDDQGRLLMARDGELVRSELPLTAGNDQAGDVLGPGCAGRDRFDGYSGDPIELTVDNGFSEPVTVWAIDGQYRWHLAGEVAANSEVLLTDFSLRTGYFVQVLDAQGNCAIGKYAKEKDTELALAVGP